MSDSGTVHPPLETDSLQHGVFPSSLSLMELNKRYWRELKNILPAQEVLVLDPYLLDAGKSEPDHYAGNVAALLKPVLDVVPSLVLVHGKPRPGIQQLFERNFTAMAPQAKLTFHHRASMHSRYLVADRARVLRMEFSFNQIGRVFGTVSLVENAEDRNGILSEIDRVLMWSGN
jgi:hypothetical protein